MAYLSVKPLAVQAFIGGTLVPPLVVLYHYIKLQNKHLLDVAAPCCHKAFSVVFFVIQLNFSL